MHLYATGTNEIPGRSRKFIVFENVHNEFTQIIQIDDISTAKHSPCALKTFRIASEKSIHSKVSNSRFEQAEMFLSDR